MNKLCVMPLFLLGLALPLLAQTNVSLPTDRLLTLPQARLRPLIAETQVAAGEAHARYLLNDETTVQRNQATSGRKGVTDPAAGASSGRETAQLEAGTSMDYFDPDLFHHLEQSGCFVHASGPPTGLARCVENVFRPEVIRLGQTKITCSLYTAIKRKNPLCLLNPLFFNLEW